MTGKGRIGIVVVATVLVCVMGVGLYVWTNREPTYHGKPLSEWLHELAISGGFAGIKGTNPEEAKSAFRELGPRGRRFLTGRILARQSWWEDRALRWLNQKVPWMVSKPPYVSTERSRAVEVFRILGAETKLAVPRLIKGLQYPWSRRAAIQALGHIGPDARESVPTLLELVASDGETPPIEIRFALYALRQIGVGGEAVPTLIELIPVARSEHLWVAASVLRDIGSPAERAVREVIMNEDPGPKTKGFLVWSLGSSDSVSPATMDELVRLGCDPGQPQIVRRGAVNALGRIGVKDKATFKRIAAAVDDASGWELSEGIRNTGFEEGSIGRISPGSGDLPGWDVYCGKVGSRLRRRNPGEPDPDMVDLGPNGFPGCIEQTLITTPNTRYTIKLQCKPGRNTDLEVRFGDARRRICLSSPKFEEKSFDFVATSYLTTISLAAVGNAGFGHGFGPFGPFVDNISVKPASTGKEVAESPSID